MQNWLRVVCRVVLPLIVLLTCVGVRGAAAQGLGYAMAGPAGFSGFFGSGASIIHAAGGGEWQTPARIGIGGEFGILGGSGGVLFVLSINGSLHLTQRSIGGATATLSDRGLHDAEQRAFRPCMERRWGRTLLAHGPRRHSDGISRPRAARPSRRRELLGPPCWYCRQVSRDRSPRSSVN